MKINPTGFWSDVKPHEHAISVPLADWIAAYLPKDEWTYDLGCGTGGYLEQLGLAGFQRLVGYEGEPPTPRKFENVKQFNLAKDLWDPALETGNVICLEVAEHVPAEFMDRFLDNITAACKEHLVTSWAVRGQGGDGHVNCLDNREVIPLFEKRGFEYLPDMSQAARSEITDLPWFRNTVLIFRRHNLGRV